MLRAVTTIQKFVSIGIAILASAGLSACADEGSSGGQGPGARVTRVIDGDTVEMERLGKVRLIGVDTPEKMRCYDDAATRFTRDHLEGQVVQYELGEKPKDRYERKLAYLTREGDMHNLTLVSEGYAKVLTIPPNDKYEARFEKAERDARKADSGLWGKCDRDKIRARRAAARRREEAAEARRIEAAARREARRARRLVRAEARRARAAARRAWREAQEDSGGGSGGGSCGPGDIDGDGDGVCNEGGGGSSDGGSSGFSCGPGDIDGDDDGRCNE